MNEKVSGAMGRSWYEKGNFTVAGEAGCAKCLAGESVSNDVVAMYGAISVLAVGGVVAARVHRTATVRTAKGNTGILIHRRVKVPSEHA